MIEDGYLVPGANLSPLKNWHLSNPFWHALLIGALVTVIVYQATALIIDLCLGFKKAGQVSFADLFILLRTEDMSIRHLIQIFRSGNHKAPCTDKLGELIESDRARHCQAYFVKSTVKLFFLLVAIPVINLMGIFITLESDRPVSFHQANFGGISLGVIANNSEPPRLSTVSDDCEELLTKVEGLSRVVTPFFFCHHFARYRWAGDEATYVLLQALPDGQVRLGVFNAVNGVGATLEIVLDHAEQSYRVPHSITKHQASELIQIGANIISSECNPSEDDLPSLSIQEEDGFLPAYHRFICIGDVTSLTMHNALMSMVQRVSAIEDDNLRVLKLGDDSVDSKEFQVVDDFLFYIWRGSHVSFPVLAILAACLVAIRCLVTLLTQNDIHLGIELIVKSQLGWNMADSMLANGSSFEYERLSMLREVEGRLQRKVLVPSPAYIKPGEEGV